MCNQCQLLIKFYLHDKKYSLTPFLAWRCLLSAPSIEKTSPSQKRGKPVKSLIPWDWSLFELSKALTRAGHPWQWLTRACKSSTNTCQSLSGIVNHQQLSTRADNDWQCLTAIVKLMGRDEISSPNMTSPSPSHKRLYKWIWAVMDQYGKKTRYLSVDLITKRTRDVTITNSGKLKNLRNLPVLHIPVKSAEISSFCIFAQVSPKYHQS